LILAKIFKYLFVHQKENPQKPQAKVKSTRNVFEVALESRRKATTNLQKVFLRGRTKLKKVEPQDQKLKKNKRAYKHEHRK
jgi:hypothetical protein